MIPCPWNHLTAVPKNGGSLSHQRSISANFLAGYPYAITYAGPQIRGVKKGSWTWFDRLTPVARVGSSILLSPAAGLMPRCS